MKRSVLFVVYLLAAAVISPSWAAGDAVAGKAKTAVCAGCHGSDGNSAIAAFPKLAGLGEKYLTEQLRYIKTNERMIVEMTGLLDNSSDQDLQDMAAYYDSQQRQLAGAQEITLVGISEPQQALALGERIYRAGNLETGVAACIACHSPAGHGNGPAGYPALGGQFAEYTEKQLLAYRRGERNTGANAKIMQGVAAALSDREIKALANYIAGLN
ncbi:MAG: c-type cytochrome [Porticoccaceae bacterium]